MGCPQLYRLCLSWCSVCWWKIYLLDICIFFSLYPEGGVSLECGGHSIWNLEMSTTEIPSLHIVPICFKWGGTLTVTFGLENTNQLGGLIGNIIPYCCPSGYPTHSYPASRSFRGFFTLHQFEVKIIRYIFVLLFSLSIWCV